MEFKIGDIIKLGRGPNNTKEYNRNQVITEIKDDHYITRFMDTFEMNCFGCQSVYVDKCILVKRTHHQWDGEGIKFRFV